MFHFGEGVDVIEGDIASAVALSKEEGPMALVIYWVEDEGVVNVRSVDAGVMSPRSAVRPYSRVGWVADNPGGDEGLGNVPFVCIPGFFSGDGQEGLDDVVSEPAAPGGGVGEGAHVSSVDFNTGDMLVGNWVSIGNVVWAIDEILESLMVLLPYVEDGVGVNWRLTSNLARWEAASIGCL